MSMPIEHERRQFLWYFLYLCWDRPDIHSGLISNAHDGLSAGVELSCDGGDRYAVLQQIFRLGC